MLEVWLEKNWIDQGMTRLGWTCWFSLQEIEGFWKPIKSSYFVDFFFPKEMICLNGFTVGFPIYQLFDQSVFSYTPPPSGVNEKMQMKPLAHDLADGRYPVNSIINYEYWFSSQALLRTLPCSLVWCSKCTHTALQSSRQSICVNKMNEWSLPLRHLPFWR